MKTLNKKALDKDENNLSENCLIEFYKELLKSVKEITIFNFIYPL